MFHSKSWKIHISKFLKLCCRIRSTNVLFLWILCFVRNYAQVIEILFVRIILTRDLNKFGFGSSLLAEDFSSIYSTMNFFSPQIEVHYFEFDRGECWWMVGGVDGEAVMSHSLRFPVLCTCFFCFYFVFRVFLCFVCYEALSSPP